MRNTLGFTIVELLVVIVVIGVLSAVVVVAFNGVTSASREARIENQLSQGRKQAEVDRANNDGKWSFEDAVRAKLAEGSDTATRTAAQQMIRDYFDKWRLASGANNCSTSAQLPEIESWSGRLKWSYAITVGCGTGSKIFFVTGNDMEIRTGSNMLIYM